MEILALKLRVTEEDINQLATRYLPSDQQVQDLKVQITPAGVVIRGVYKMMMNIPFEMTWALSVQAGRVAAELASLKVSGFGGGMVKPILWSMISETAERDGLAEVDGEKLLIDPDQVLAKNGLPAKTNLSRVVCEKGHLTLEAGA